MKKALITLGIIVALVIILIILGPLYILSEGEQSVVTRFGAIVKVETEPGLKFKMPFVDTVVRYSSKILSWDGDAQRIPTKENQFIYVDPTSRWIISDPKRFYETVKTVENAQLRLDDILDSTVRTVISENYLNEAVRNSNRINEMTVVEEVSSIDDLEAAERLRSLTVSNTQQESIRVGRQGLSDRMLELAGGYTKEYGITLIDVVIRQIKYSDDLTESADSLNSGRERPQASRRLSSPALMHRQSRSRVLQMPRPQRFTPRPTSLIPSSSSCGGHLTPTGRQCLRWRRCCPRT